eukprot:m.170053 g.170053  ORF g.170053 m.170053 type:complete len:97 (-) comp15272_c0_seq17:792-1082(-)
MACIWSLCFLPPGVVVGLIITVGRNTGDSPELVFPWHAQLLRATLYMIAFFWAYMIMLIFMIMSGPVCIACCLGAGIGFFVFHRTTAFTPEAGCCP